MKKYEAPKIEIIETNEKEILTASISFEDINDSPIFGVETNW